MNIVFTVLILLLAVAASGLVALRFSAAAVSGEFSITSASLSFVFIAVGGLAIGWALAWLFVKARSFLNYRQVSDPTNHQFKINDVTLRHVMADIDLTEAALSGGQRSL